MLDLTSLWVFYQKHKQGAGQLLVGVLLFAAGWQLGRVMSPYYAVHPIVFNDNGRPAAGGAMQELVALKQEGEQRQAQAPVSSAVPAPSVAGTTTGAYVASVNSNLYHHPDCPSAKRIKDVNQVWFASQQEAEAAGYSPSKCTIDKLAETEG